MQLFNDTMKPNLIPLNLALTTSATICMCLAAHAQVIMTDIGPTAPTPGPDDIAQLSTSPKTSELEVVIGGMDFGARFWRPNSLIGNGNGPPGAPAGS